MHKQLELYAPLLGRILIGGFFLLNGVAQALNVLATVLIFSKIGVPYAEVWALVAIAIEVLGGALLVVGFKSRFVASVLALYVALTSMLLVTSAQAVELQLFLEGIAVVGGLLYVASYGSGRWSTDS